MTPIMLIANALDDYAERYAAGNPHTFRAKKYDLGYFFDFCRGRGATTLKQLTPALLASFVAHRRTVGEAPRTIQRRLNNVLAFINWCARTFRDFDNPTPEVKRVQVPQQTPKWLEPAELEAIRTQTESGSTLDIRNKAMLELMARAGLRRFEIVNLNVGQLDQKKWLLRDVLRKGGRFQTIFLAPTCIDALKAYLPERDKVLSAATRERNGVPSSSVISSRALPLFISTRSSDFRISGETVYRVTKNIAEDAGVSSVHPHRLRHTFINDFLQKTKDIRLTAAVAGHSNMQTTLLYTEPKEEQQRDAISLLD